MKFFMIFFALLAMAAAQVDPVKVVDNPGQARNVKKTNKVNVVDNNNPGHVNVVDNNYPGHVNVVDNNYPGHVNVVDNNNPGHVNIVDNNPHPGHIVISNPDPGFSQPTIGGGSGYEPIDNGPAYINRPYPGKQFNEYYRQPAGQNGFEPIDVGAYIITTPRGYDPLTGTINQGGFQGNRYPGKEYKDPFLRGGK